MNERARRRFHQTILSVKRLMKLIQGLNSTINFNSTITVLDGKGKEMWFQPKVVNVFFKHTQLLLKLL